MLIDNVTTLIEQARFVVKSPPGPPPRPGLEWNESTHRWIKRKKQRFYDAMFSLPIDIAREIIYNYRKAKKLYSGQKYKEANEAMMRVLHLARKVYDGSTSESVQVAAMKIYDFASRSVATIQSKMTRVEEYEYSKESG